MSEEFIASYADNDGELKPFTMQFLDDCIAELYERTCYESEVRLARTMPERWNAIRRFYRYIEPKIMNTPANRWAIYAYPFCWDHAATPIEKSAWHDIRFYCAVMYPQYPVGKYFTDFANPVLRIALELDGAKYHDPVKDRKRDAEMREMGWRVYRVPGHECMRIVNLADIEDYYGGALPDGAMDTLHRWAFSTVSGVVYGMANYYFDRFGSIEWSNVRSDWDEYYYYKYQYAYESMQQHRTA